MHLNIRRAEADDAADIASIYNHYVRHSTATFDTELKTFEDRVRWLAEHGDDYPVVVGELDGRVIAWGSLSRWATRPAWAGTVEVSVYVAHDATGSGVGPEVLAHLVDAGRAAGFHALIAQIVADNQPSIKMAERAGFERVGTLREVGRKFDRWLDVALVERIIEDGEE